ncbi:GH25 family lysozyme [Microlunatus sp. GCM10028923]|uniref:GH25 family lysozyme n=1 Tax=Microlunatus sp. GCM10028923 TaxID=3273400 RepID=UPI0036184F5D
MYLSRRRPLVAAVVALLALSLSPALAYAETPTHDDQTVTGEGGRMGGSDRLAGPRERSDRNDPAAPAPEQPPAVLGIDVSGHNENVDWAKHRADGKRFAYIKATEGSTFQSSKFSAQYTDSYYAGYVRGAYHFARPDGKPGDVQADFFVDHGGSWSADGQTLPGVLDIEGPYFDFDECWGLTPDQMVTWIRAFTTRYVERTGRQAVIYTGYYWWEKCTGNSAAFGETNPLWLAAWRTTPPEKIPAGWSGGWTFWQYTDTPLDQNRYAGDYPQLQEYATGGPID